jgi:type IV secretory pathway VirB2 component (pilin)
MKRTTVIQGVVCAIATCLLSAPAFARQGDSRPTDKAVVQIIESVEKGRNAFEAAIDDKAKASIVKAPRGELRVDAFLDDLETSVKNLKGKFDKSYSAASEAETVLRQASVIDAFVKTAGQGMKGATEWTTFATDLSRLAGAYGTTFPMAAAGGTVRRVNDADATAAADDMKRQAQRMRQSIEGNAGIAKNLRDAAMAELTGLEQQADLVKARVSSGQPASTEMQKLLAHVAAVDKFMGANKVMPQTQAYWEAARVPLDKLKQAYAVK